MPEHTGPGDHRAVVRTIAVIVLIAVALVALRGYLPEASEPRPEPERLDSGSGSVAAVVAMLAVSLAAIAISVLAQARQRSGIPSAAEPHRAPRAGPLRLRWRPLLIAAAILLAWSVVLLLLMRWVSPLPLDEPPAPQGASATDPAEGAEPGPAPAPRQTGAGDSVFGILAVATVVLLGLSVVGTLRGRRQIPAPAVPVEAPSDATTGGAGPDLVRAAELGLAEVDDPNRDAREAIIACYLAMERELEKSPGTTPQDSDTPSEVLARATRHHALQADSAAELVDLFEETRFSPHVMDDGHRVAAVRALQAVLRDLRVAP
ncbi:DUF4129 domain-containing protein [Mycolicibacterium gilvum]|uniref:Protein-glutamine gamma-glutamyltransferase-like C-terminal domain-containing protein n=1 Tax=Mycolicibacterium gilvum (strain PYR-GCK) TaxID=350054 RepID=A4T3P8_MYCGI|nr:conserved hypothetical protein [Mycolicibacterium gilvum PYR-GCK]